MYNIATSQVIAQRHQFVYGYNNEERKQFLEKVYQDYPVVINQDVPIAIPISQYGLPEIKEMNESLDKTSLLILARDYFEYSILYNILFQIQKQTKFDLPKENINKFLKETIYMNFNEPNKIHTLDDAVSILDRAMNDYYKKYSKYVSTGELEYPESPVTYVSFDELIQDIKNLIGNTAYFGLLIDYQNPIALESYQAINSLIYSRCTGTTPVTVILEPEEWKTYTELTGSFVEYIHDYSTLELDDSYNEHMKKITPNT